ncbi:MAG: response regulator transcription factor [Chitinophagaceae bacterium]|nr:MAG: response regulator transcription factor [Chitinophagaceae bacterium]
MKILIVEDEPDLSKDICTYLSNEKYSCEQAFDFGHAWDKISLYDYACIILDIGLPGGSGIELLELLKKSDKAEGVLLISAKNSIEDKVSGLNAGADDYLTKPFHLSELAARVSAIIRRKSFEGKNVIVFDSLSIDMLQKEVHVNGAKVELTRKEFDLLLYFVSNRNKVIAKSALAIHLWGDNMDLADNYDIIYTHIKNLRRKLGAGGGPDYIRSVYGMGYKFSAE